MKTVNGKVINIWAPSALGFIKGMNPFGGTVWSLLFKCGQCGVKSTVQHDERKEHHKCPVCKTINILDRTSYYDDMFN